MNIFYFGGDFDVVLFEGRFLVWYEFVSDLDDSEGFFGFWVVGYLDGFLY